MDKNRLWTIAVSGLIVVVLVLGWFLGVSPLIQQTATASSDRASVAATNDANEARVGILKKEFAGIGTLQAKLATLGQSVPSDADMAVFLREIDALTIEHKVTLGTVRVDAAVAYVPPVAAVVPAAAGSTATPTPSPSASTGPAVVADTGPSGRLILVPVKIRVSGVYSNVMAFVGGIQNGARLYLVNDLSVQASTANPGEVDGDISGWVYALPLPAGVASLATGAEAAAKASSTAQAEASATPSPTPTP